MNIKTLLDFTKNWSFALYFWKPLRTTIFSVESKFLDNMLAVGKKYSKKFDLSLRFPEIYFASEITAKFSKIYIGLLKRFRILLRFSIIYFAIGKLSKKCSTYYNFLENVSFCKISNRK